jgi:hypothetical protein
MRKTVTTLLLLSLAANALLAWLTLAPGRPAGGTRVAGPAQVISVKPASGAAVPQLPAGSNLHGWRDTLRALGLAENEVRAAVKALVEAPRRARLREWLAQAPRPLWWQGSGMPKLSAAQQEELRRLARAEREALHDLFGPTARASAQQLERYAYLPRDKAERLVALEWDYAELLQEVKGGGADAEARRRLLAAERARDTEALLTPEERAMVDQRQSQTALNLAAWFDAFQPTEREAQAIYALQRPFDDRYRGSDGFSGEVMKARPAASETLQRELEAALGPERFAEWQRAQRPEYLALVELRRRFAVDQAGFDLVARLPAQTSAEAARIAADDTLNAGQKQAAHAALVQEARRQTLAALGPELGQSYLDSTTAWWLGAMGRRGSLRGVAIGVDAAAPPKR